MRGSRNSSSSHVTSNVAISAARFSSSAGKGKGEKEETDDVVSIVSSFEEGEMEIDADDELRLWHEQMMRQELQNANANAALDDTSTIERSTSLPDLKAWNWNSIVLGGENENEKDNHSKSVPTSNEMEQRDFSKMSSSQACFLLQTDPMNGLEEEEANRRLEHYGENVLHVEKRISFVVLVLHQFADFIMILLVIASAVSFGLQDYIDGGTILAIAVANAIIHAVQELWGDKRLHEFQPASSVVVIRQGRRYETPASKLVPGDVIALSVFVSTEVFADARIIEASTDLCCVETVLTGILEPVAKHSQIISEAELGDRFLPNMVYAGTQVTSGRGTAVVVATGRKTQFKQTLQSQKRRLRRENRAQRRLYLQRELRNITIVQLIVGLVLAFIVFASTAFQLSYVLDSAVYAVVIVIAILPSELALALTVAEAMGVARLARNFGVILRNGTILEELGRVTTICTVKAASITEGKLSVAKIWSPETEHPNSVHHLHRDDLSRSLRIMIEIAGRCNVNYRAIDRSLLQFARLLGYRETSRIIEEFSFDPHLKRMSVVVQDSNGFNSVLARGAADSILPLCNRIYHSNSATFLSIFDGIAQIKQQIDLLATEGLTVIAFAVRGAICNEHLETTDVSRKKRRVFFEKDLAFVGLVGLLDRARPEMRDLVQICRRAGIAIHMLTGDSAKTAAAIAKQIELIDGEEKSAFCMSEHFDQLSDEMMKNMEMMPKVIAECSSVSKVRLLNELRSRNFVVAFVGKTVLDLRALESANVRIAIGSGSHIIQQDAHVVLQRDNLVGLVHGISEGKRLLFSIEKLAIHVISINVGLVILLMIGLIFRQSNGSTLYPLSPLEIVFLTSIFLPASIVGLVIEDLDFDVMTQPPHQSRHLLRKYLILDIIIYGLAIGAIGIAIYSVLIFVFGSGLQIVGSNATNYSVVIDCNLPENFSFCETYFSARSAVFLSMTLMILFSSFNCRHQYHYFWHNLARIHFAMIIATISVIIIAFIVIFVPGLNLFAMRHSEISWKIGFSFAAVILFAAITILWKAIAKRTRK